MGSHGNNLRKGFWRGISSLVFQPIIWNLRYIDFEIWTSISSSVKWDYWNLLCLSRISEPRDLAQLPYSTEEGAGVVTCQVLGESRGRIRPLTSGPRPWGHRRMLLGVLWELNIEKRRDLWSMHRHECLHAQSCPIFCDPMKCSPPDSSVHGILQARILEWGAIPFSRGFSWPRDQTHISSIGRQILYH